LRTCWKQREESLRHQPRFSRGNAVQTFVKTGLTVVMVWPEE
jgi:hypothetical protein